MAVVQYKNNQRKNLAMSLRRGGYSYSEIQNFVSVPKATLAYWFREVELTEPQLERLRKKRSEAAKVGSQSRVENLLKAIEAVKKSSAKEIGKLSKRELWLMGVVLYWKNHNMSDIRKGVHFMSSDPFLILLFLKWLKEVGGLSQEEITLDLFLDMKKKAKASGKRSSKSSAPVVSDRSLQDAVEFWSTCTGFPPGHIAHVYRHKNKSKFGLLRIRVRASSMLARQLAGWITGIQESIKP